MKKLRLWTKQLSIWLLGLAAGLSPAFGSAPTAATQTASNITVSAAILRGYGKGGGETTFVWFEWGTTTSYGTETTHVNIGNGTTNYNVTASISSLPGGTVFQYRTVASNATAVSYGGNTTFATTSSSYDFVGVGWENVDVTRPLGSELGMVWDDVARQTRAAGRGAMENEHDATGHHQDGFIDTAMLGDGQVTMDKLSAAVQTAISDTGSVTVEGTLTNALTYMAHNDNAGTAIKTTTTDASLGTIALAVNTYNRILITVEVHLNNETGGNRVFNSIKIKVGGIQVADYPSMKLQSNRSELLNLSAMINGGQGTSQTIDITAQSDNTSVNDKLTARLLKIRVWGVP